MIPEWLLRYFIAIPPKDCNFLEFLNYWAHDCTFISLYIKVVVEYSKAFRKWIRNRSKADI